jgi:hypothetical protein
VRTYGELFTSALDKHGGVCLGLYRRRHADLVTSSRIVITNPPFSLPLQHTDQVTLNGSNVKLSETDSSHKRLWVPIVEYLT